MSDIRTYDDAMAWIHDRSGYDRGFISNPFAGDEAARLGLVRTQRILDVLGNPERDYPIVHVAGSKGKGSTTIFLDAIFREMNLRSGRFMSPHLHRFNERFAVDGDLIPDDDFAGMVAKVKDATTQVEASDPEIGTLTAWEISTAVALLWFSEASCDIAVIEVGLGGTLDATNVVQPVASVITRLDLEHQGILGSTIEEIASNKAGIIKPGAPVFTVAQPGRASDVIASKAAECGVPLMVAGRDWQATGSSDDFNWSFREHHLNHLTGALVGDHQVENAGLALAVVHELAERGAVQNPGAGGEVQRALATVVLAGRLEQASTPNGVDIIIDGAHTPESVRAVVHTLRQRYPERRIIAVVGMLNDKQPDDVLPALDSVVATWLVAPLQSPRTAQVKDLAESLARRGISATQNDSVAAALSLADRIATPGDLILVIGSLTTVTEARRCLGLGA